MNERAFDFLEQVVQNPLFPDVDLALRRGRHIDVWDGEWYAFLLDAQTLLEPFYRRYGCELIKVNDGYFHLRPSGQRLGRRLLSRGEMLVGQGLALMYLDPSTLKAEGVVPAAQVLELLANLVGQERLLRALNPRRGVPRDARVAEETARRELATALRGLERLGFVDRLEGDRLRLRTALLRFADPVRGLTDKGTALARLIERGEVVVEADEAEQAVADDDGTDEGGDDA